MKGGSRYRSCHVCEGILIKPPMLISTVLQVSLQLPASIQPSSGKGIQYDVQSYYPTGLCRFKSARGWGTLF